ncbi:hypothetical protein ABTI40_19665, partial [Acinetobacter baumannii]
MASVFENYVGNQTCLREVCKFLRVDCFVWHPEGVNRPIRRSCYDRETLFRVAVEANGIGADPGLGVAEISMLLL